MPPAGRLQQSFPMHAELPAAESRHTLNSYRELDRQPAALAHIMSQAGVRAGDIVPLLMRRSPALVAAHVGVLRLGAA